MTIIENMNDDLLWALKGKYKLMEEREDIWIPLLKAVIDVYGLAHRDLEATPVNEECFTDGCELCRIETAIIKAQEIVKNL